MLKRISMNGISLSQVSFGSMRYDSNVESKEADLLKKVFERGISTFHSSGEYSTFPLFCSSFKKKFSQQQRNQTQHIIKIPAPHFKDSYFCPRNLEKRVDRALESLGIEVIDVVQWLLRFEPNIDKNRIPLLKEIREEYEEIFTLLRNKGKVNSWFSFPYSKEFSLMVLDLKTCGGLVDYLNPFEIISSDIVAKIYHNDLNIIALRPFLAKKVLNLSQDKQNTLNSLLQSRTIVESALKFPLLSSKVLTEVISINNLAQLDSVVKFTNSLKPDDLLFLESMKSIQEVPLSD